MDWTSFLKNPESIKHLYEEVPLLKNVKLKSLNLKEDGPTLVLKIELPTYPKNPPKKWMKNEFNTVSLDLSFVEITNLTICNWDIENIVNITITEKKKKLTVMIVNDITEISLNVSHLYIMKISAYKNSLL